ncbi:MAG TPA: hypothetical protein PKK00_05715 [Bacteroidales bacterium]|nr:hypothetical protein [Bacteroidales bacterium]HPS16339.1 hypothetical protein [Bacteroidales bacterium]
MKNKKLLLLLSFIIILVFNGCKKGEEDPLVSFLSRKARICRNWEVTEGRVSYGTPQLSEIYKFGEDNRLIYQENQGSIEGFYKWRFEIKNDGSYRIYQNLNFPYNYTYVLDEQGYWYFLSKNKDGEAKNKEYVAFQAVSVQANTTNYSYQAASPTVYRIVQLKNKSMKLEGIRDNTKTEGSCVSETKIIENLTLSPDKD